MNTNILNLHGYRIEIVEEDSLIVRESDNKFLQGYVHDGPVYLINLNQYVKCDDINTFIDTFDKLVNEFENDGFNVDFDF